MGDTGFDAVSVTDDVATVLRQTVEIQTASDAAGAAIYADLDWLTGVWPALSADVRAEILTLAGDAASGV